jgi:endonuclease/exonuclease/phosphatase family metal-dependent hydrolase
MVDANGGNAVTLPEHDLTVVTANVQQGREDPAKSNQMEIFVDRVIRFVPKLPDVLLLQEVSRASATRIAKFLRQKTPFRYEVAIGPAAGVVQKSDESEEVIWDSAIVLNTDVMEVIDAGGVITTTYPPIDARPGILVRTKQHSHLGVRKIGGKVPIALASVHLVTGTRLALVSLAFCYKNQWCKDILGVLNQRYPRPGYVHVIGGDFNNARCMSAPDLPETIKCDQWPFWRTFTTVSEYKDAIFTVHGTSDRSLRKQARRGNRMAKPRIDYIFTTGAVENASHDLTYSARPGQPGFYSDHRFLWEQLALPVDLPQVPPTAGDAITATTE